MVPPHEIAYPRIFFPRFIINFSILHCRQSTVEYTDYTDSSVSRLFVYSRKRFARDAAHLLKRGNKALTWLFQLQKLIRSTTLIKQNRNTISTAIISNN